MERADTAASSSVRVECVAGNAANVRPMIAAETATHPVYPVLAGMAPEARAALLARLARRNLAPNEVVLRAGQPNAQVILIVSGQLRAERSSQDVSPLGVVLGAGDCAGEMSALSGGNTSATVRAVTAATVLLLPVAELEREETGTVAIRLAQRVADRLAQTNSRLELKKRHANAAMNLQRRSAVMAAMLIVPLSFYVLFVALRTPLAGYWPHEALLSAFLVVVCFGFAWVFVTRVSRPRQLGMSHAQAARGSFAGVRLSLPILVAVVIAKAVYVARHPDHALFEPLLGTVGTGVTGWTAWGVCLSAYVALCYLQEVVRCAIQGSIAEYLHGGGLPDRWRSPLIATLLFGATHVHLSFGFALLAMAGGGYWSWMYQRERNYWAPAASHAAIGTWALFIVGIPQ